MDKVTSIISKLDNDISSLAIKDLFRLGKYDKNKSKQSKPRPVMVKFVRKADAYQKRISLSLHFLLNLINQFQKGRTSVC